MSFSPSFVPFAKNSTFTIRPSLSVAFAEIVMVWVDSKRLPSAGAVSGTFAGLPQNTDFVLQGRHYRISYTGGDGNDVIIITTNNPPVITQVSDQTIIEQIPFNLQIAATDADPADELTFTLDPGSPTNSTISNVNATNALFSWTPTEDQGPGHFTVTVRATDNGFSAKTTTMSFQVNVLNTNLPPAIVAPATVISNELTLIRFNVSANDPDSPPANLIFELLQSPSGKRLRKPGSLRSSAS